MTDKKEAGGVEESPKKSQFRTGYDEPSTPAGNHGGNQQNSKKRPFEEVDDAPTPESVKKARKNIGQPFFAPVPKLQLTAPPPAVPPAIDKTGRRPEILEPFMNLDFLPGYIIKAPFHETMMDRNPNLNDPRVRASMAQSSVAKISSKQRPAIVLAAFRDKMLVMPTGTRGGRDLSHIPNHIRHEYIGIREFPNNDHLDRGVHKHSLLAYMDRDQSLSELSAVRLSHVATTNYQEDIKIVGALSEDSTKWLIATWLGMRQDAEDHGWERDRRLVLDRQKERRDRDYTYLNNKRRRT